MIRAEECEKYDLEIYKDSEVIRAINISNSTSETYTIKAQIEDFNALQQHLDINIYRLPAMIGRG